MRHALILFLGSLRISAFYLLRYGTYTMIIIFTIIIILFGILFLLLFLLLFPFFLSCFVLFFKEKSERT